MGSKEETVSSLSDLFVNIPRQKHAKHILRSPTNPKAMPRIESPKLHITDDRGSFSKPKMISRRCRISCCFKIYAMSFSNNANSELHRHCPYQVCWATHKEVPKLHESCWPPAQKKNVSNPCPFLHWFTFQKLPMLHPLPGYQTHDLVRGACHQQGPAEKAAGVTSTICNWPSSIHG